LAKAISILRTVSSSPASGRTYGRVKKDKKILTSSSINMADIFAFVTSDMTSEPRASDRVICRSAKKDMRMPEVKPAALTTAPVTKF